MYNNKTIFYCIPTLNCQDLLPGALKAAFEGSLAVDYAIVVDNGASNKTGVTATQVLQDFKYRNNILILPQRVNTGVSKPWNVFLRRVYNPNNQFGMYAQYNENAHCIIANDDVVVHDNTIKDLVDAAEQTPDNVFFCGSGHSGNAFSLFLLTARGFKEVGEFDEQFTPAYFEDNDMMRRLILAGYYEHVVQSARYNHKVSETIRRFTKEQKELQHKRFERNQVYYGEKWGGMPNGEPNYEVYSIPFNGRDSKPILEAIADKYGY